MTAYVTRPLLAALFVVAEMAAGLAQARQVTKTDQQFTLPPQTPPVGQQAPYGYPVAGNATRTITIDQKTRYVNVTRLETVTINAGGKSVTWSFDTLDTRSFALSQILPGVDNVTVYVSESPLYGN